MCMYIRTSLPAHEGAGGDSKSRQHRTAKHCQALTKAWGQWPWRRQPVAAMLPARSRGGRGGKRTRSATPVLAQPHPPPHPPPRPLGASQPPQPPQPPPRRASAAWTQWMQRRRRGSWSSGRQGRGGAVTTAGATARETETATATATGAGAGRES